MPLVAATSPSPACMLCCLNASRAFGVAAAWVRTIAGFPTHHIGVTLTGAGWWAVAVWSSPIHVWGSEYQLALLGITCMYKKWFTNAICIGSYIMPPLVGTLVACTLTLAITLACLPCWARGKHVAGSISHPLDSVNLPQKQFMNVVKRR